MINKQRNHKFMHFKWFWITNSFSCQAFQASSKIQVFTFDFLGIRFSGFQNIVRNNIVVRIVIIGINGLNVKIYCRYQLHKLPKHFVLSRTQNKSYNITVFVIYCVPKPTWCAFAINSPPTFHPFEALFWAVFLDFCI